MSEILVIEDDPILACGLQIMLELEGYSIILANNLSKAASLLSGKTLLVILDLNLPDGNGSDFLKQTRATHASLPVIILTAVAEEDSAVHCLELGANDYIRKPFGNRELIARINGILKKAALTSKNLQYGDVKLLLEQRQALYLGKKIELNRREFDILLHLFQRAENIVTRDSILNSIDKECRISDRTIDSHISHLRSSLNKAGVNQIKITSVYGIGYRIEKT